jgi:AcrR family transcriptional regulator
VSRVDDPPARGTRPRNRREITITAASSLFYRHGYPSVSMSDIAAAMNVGASAIYRHFGGKSELLVAAIRSGLSPYKQVIETWPRADGSGAPQLAELARLTAEVGLDHRELGVLWQREARNLDELDQRILRDELTALTRGFAGIVMRARPGLDEVKADFLSWCAMGTLVSVGFHSLSLRRDRYVDLLSSMVETVLTTTLPEDKRRESVPVEQQADAVTRRDALVSEAIELFAERGYGGVGIDDIADAAGIAGPSIYSHFASKQKILAEAMRRGNDVLQRDAAAALESRTSPQVTLARLVDSFIALAISNRFLVRIVLSELDQLDSEDRDFALHEQREYVSTWSGLLESFGGIDATSARIRVQAVLLVVNDAVQTPHLRALPELERWLREVSRRMLEIPVDGV